jgi:hypothetical protein
VERSLLFATALIEAKLFGYMQIEGSGDSAEIFDSIKVRATASTDCLCLVKKRERERERGKRKLLELNRSSFFEKHCLILVMFSDGKDINLLGSRSTGNDCKNGGRKCTKTGHSEFRPSCAR